MYKSEGKERKGEEAQEEESERRAQQELTNASNTYIQMHMYTHTHTHTTYIYIYVHTIHSFANFIYTFNASCKLYVKC